MKKFFGASGILMILLFLVFYLLDVHFTSVYRRGTFFKTQWIHSKQDGAYDYAVLGASRSISALNFEELSGYTGLQGINLSLDGSFISSQYLILKIFLSHGNRIDRLYLNVDTWQINNNFVSQFSYPRFLPYLKEDIVFDHFKVFGAKWYAYRYVPFLRYAIFNFDWGLMMYSNSFLNFIEPNYDNYGCFFYPALEFDGVENRQAYLFDFEKDLTYLDKIISLCKENHIELELFIPPIVNLDTSGVYFQNMEDFADMMRRRNVEFTNYGHEFIGEFNLFTDEAHLNRYGVNRFTDVFKIKLKQDFE